jgi:hypothetical protein
VLNGSGYYTAPTAGQVAVSLLNAQMRSCNNPTFSTDGTNTLVQNDPMPAACDRQGPTQCVTGGDGGLDIGLETIDANIPSSEGVFSVTVSETPVQLSDAVLSGDNATFESTGQLGTVTISEGRNQTLPGWSVSGQIGDFTGGGNTFSGRYLGWTPVVTTQNPAGDVVAGLPVFPGTDPGLTGGSRLATALASQGAGTAVLGATLDLRMPSSTPTGRYSATLTITVIASAG